LAALTLTPLRGIPEIVPGADLAGVIAEGLAASGIALAPLDVLVVAQKIVSKAEDRFVELATVQASARARDYARMTGKDPRYVELVLRESLRVVRARPGVLIVEHRLGHVMANAGIDQSNVPGGADRVLLLPEDPEASCRALGAALRARCGVEPAVLMNDSFGRPWRQGVTGTALGVSGLPALVDRRGAQDRQGRRMQMTQVALADELAAAASLVMGQADEGTPVVHGRGVPYARRHGSVQELIRPAAEDLFR
jgi:coenzyme F420-0:L-glutamate ligase/coenzyme F420-1:gamma-L-glutamate ligase